MTRRNDFEKTVHRHITVDGRRVDRPSFRLTSADVVQVAERSREKYPFVLASAGGYATETPAYLEVNRAALAARLIRIPQRREVPVICDEQLVVEFYSR